MTLIEDSTRRSGGVDAVARAPKKHAAVFDGASNGRRTAGWNARADAINTAIFQDGDLLRKRARDLVRQNWAAANGVESWVASAIGTGIKPKSLHPDRRIREALDYLFDRWSSESDADGRTDFYGQQSLAFSAMVEAGECFIRRRDRRLSDGLTVPMQIQLLESEHVPYWLNKAEADRNRVVMGLEIDGIGRVAAYHMYADHPEDYNFSRGKTDTVRVPAENIAHLFRQSRPGQRRGTTWLTQAMIKLRDLDKYDDAELVRKKMASMVVWWLTETDPNDPILATTETDSDDVAQLEIQAGQVVRLKPGEQVNTSEPAKSDAGYSDYMKHQLHEVAAAMGITYEMLTGDLEGVNFSSIRAGLLEFRRRCEMIQWSVFIFQFCRPCWAWFCRAAAMNGSISAGDLSANWADYMAVQWHTPKWSWVDPLKEVQAEQLQVLAGFKSRGTVINEMGEDPEVVDAQIAEDNARAERLGLQFSTQFIPPPGSFEEEKEEKAVVKRK